jgi:subtilisin family serine protease
VAGAGANVDVYIADTGIDRNHPELVGRARHFFTFYGNDSLDDNGHGTHAAGLAGGAVHGLAKQSTLYAVKILGADGLGSITSLLAGMNEVLCAMPGGRLSLLLSADSIVPAVSKRRTVIRTFF